MKLKKNLLIFLGGKAGLRDMLIHDYMGVDLSIVWNAIQNELPIKGLKLA